MVILDVVVEACVPRKEGEYGRQLAEWTGPGTFLQIRNEQNNIFDQFPNFPLFINMHECDFM